MPHTTAPWNWNWISANPNLTIEYVETHPEKDWDWHKISDNKFKLDPNLKYVKRRKERDVLAKFNKILRLTRTVTRTVNHDHSTHTIRFLAYHTVASIYNLDPAQISKNLLYFTKN
jgi:hypothetical protein